MELEILSKSESKSLVECFSTITDPRMDRRKRHNLIDILAIAVSAIICGAEHWTEVASFGECKKNWFSAFLELPNGIPSHDTFARVFAILDPAQLQFAYAQWVQAVMRDVDVKRCCLDGKTVRGSGHMPSGQKPIHVLSAYAREGGIVLAQRKVDDKSNEITAIPEVLRVLVLKGMIVSIDAMGRQKEIATQIKDQGGEYVLSLKGNQGNLAKAVEHHFECAERDNFELLDHDCFETVDGGHGRVETRRYDVIGDASWLDANNEWGGLTAVGRVASRREKSGTRSKGVELRYYLLSRRFSAAEFAEACRSHWSIENSPHWLLDVAFREDERQMRAGYAAENFVALRHIALHLLKQGNRIKLGIKSRRKVAGWDENYLLELLKGNFNA
jgi:predicted transposase YbfD/YdcC